VTLPSENDNLVSQGDELKLQRCAAANTEREQGNESRQNLIMRPDGMAVAPENPQSFSTVHSFELLSRDTPVYRRQSRLWARRCATCQRILRT
jgi:hypothetical protein